MLYDVSCSVINLSLVVSNLLVPTLSDLSLSLPLPQSCARTPCLVYSHQKLATPTLIGEKERGEQIPHWHMVVVFQVLRKAKVLTA